MWSLFSTVFNGWNWNSLKDFVTVDSVGTFWNGQWPRSIVGVMARLITGTSVLVIGFGCQINLIDNV